MAKKNKAIIDLQKRLICSHCSTTFVGSYSQARHFYYEQRKIYCSTKCRNEATRNLNRENAIKRGSPLYVLQGPCPTCGKYFNSAMPKKFCSMKCYTSSPDFLKMAKKASEKALEINKNAYLTKNPEGTWNKTNVTKKCLYCEKEFIARRSERKFCSVHCYRQHLADLYDKWIANPERIALPQCFDEFMTKEYLPCLVEGCEWEGHNLSVHLNKAHGIRAEDFKKAAGFNLSTGLVSPTLRDKLELRELTGVALMPQEEREINKYKWTQNDYKSLEGKEHFQKTRALKIASGAVGPTRVCKNCKKTFNKPFMGAPNILFCSVTCRTEYHKNKRREKRFVPRECIFCGKIFIPTNKYGLPAKYCSADCRSNFYKKKNKP